MAILKIKKIIEDLETGSRQVLSAVGKATSAGNTGTAYLATSAAKSGTAAYASSAGGGAGGTAGV